MPQLSIKEQECQIVHGCLPVIFLDRRQHPLKATECMSIALCQSISSIDASQTGGACSVFENPQYHMKGKDMLSSDYAGQ